MATKANRGLLAPTTRELGAFTFHHLKYGQVSPPSFVPLQTRAKELYLVRLIEQAF